MAYTKESRIFSPCALAGVLLCLFFLAACGDGASSKKREAVEQELSCGGITTIRFYDIKEFDKQCIEILEEQRANTPYSHSD